MDLELDNTAKDMEISRERNVSRRARNQADELIRQRQVQTTQISDSNNTELVVKTLDLIARNYPHVADPSYAVYDNKDFVANRAAADGFAFGLTEAVASRAILASQRVESESLTSQLQLTTDQKANLDAALTSEKLAHSKTGELLVSETELGKKNLALVTTLRDEVNAWESKFKFDLFRPKCGLGGFVGVDTKVESSIGVGIFCGWIFP